MRSLRLEINRRTIIAGRNTHPANVKISTTKTKRSEMIPAIMIKDLTKNPTTLIITFTTKVSNKALRLQPF